MLYFRVKNKFNMRKYFLKFGLIGCLATLALTSCKKEKSNNENANPQTHEVISSPKNLTEALNNPDNVLGLIEYLNNENPNHCPHPEGYIYLGGGDEKNITLKNYNLYYIPGIKYDLDGPDAFYCIGNTAVCFFTRITGNFVTIKGEEFAHEYIPSTAVITVQEKSADYRENSKIILSSDNVYKVVNL